MTSAISNGDGFGNNRVVFGSVPPLGFYVVSATSISPLLETPAALAERRRQEDAWEQARLARQRGEAPVDALSDVVDSVWGTAPEAGDAQFTYREGPFAMTNASGNEGGLSADRLVYFGSTPATTFIVESEVTISAAAPAAVEEAGQQEAALEQQRLAQQGGEDQREAQADLVDFVVFRKGHP